MTVCIANAFNASPTFASPQYKIVCVCDMMVGNDFVSADKSTFKFSWVKQRWALMFAGNVSPVIPIMNSITSASEAQAEELDGMVRISIDALEKQRTQAIEQSILSPFGLSLPGFMKSRSDLGDANFDNLRYQIENFDLGVEFLIAGFDKHLVPHIFSLCDRTPIQYHDAIGFHAIGTGSISAMGMLYNHEKYMG